MEPKNVHLKIIHQKTSRRELPIKLESISEKFEEKKVAGTGLSSPQQLALSHTSEPATVTAADA